VNQQQIYKGETERLLADARKAYMKPLAKHAVPVVKTSVKIAGADARKT